MVTVASVLLTGSSTLGSLYVARAGSPQFICRCPYLPPGLCWGVMGVEMPSSSGFEWMVKGDICGAGGVGDGVGTVSVTWGFLGTPLFAGRSSLHCPGTVGARRTVHTHLNGDGILVLQQWYL